MSGESGSLCGHLVIHAFTEPVIHSVIHAKAVCRKSVNREQLDSFQSVNQSVSQSVSHSVNQRMHIATFPALFPLPLPFPFLPFPHFPQQSTPPSLLISFPSFTPLFPPLLFHILPKNSLPFKVHPIDLFPPFPSSMRVNLAIYCRDILQRQHEVRL